MSRWETAGGGTHSYIYYLIYREGIIQPSTIGPDGRPQAVEHILELTANMDITEEHDSDWKRCTASPVCVWLKWVYG